jgi:hypothetical protein
MVESLRGKKYDRKSERSAFFLSACGKSMIESLRDQPDKKYDRKSERKNV